MVLLGALFEALCAVQQSARNEFLRNIVPFVQPLGSAHSLPKSVPGVESVVDDLRVLEHQLLRDGTTARLGVSLFVDTFEECRPRASVAATDGVSGSRAISKPRGDPLPQ